VNQAKAARAMKGEPMKRGPIPRVHGIAAAPTRTTKKKNKNDNLEKQAKMFDNRAKAVRRVQAGYIKKAGGLHQMKDRDLFTRLAVAAVISKIVFVSAGDLRCAVFKMDVKHPPRKSGESTKRAITELKYVMVSAGHVVPDFDSENGDSLFIRPATTTKAPKYDDAEGDVEAPEDAEDAEGDVEAPEDAEEAEDEAPKEVEFASVSVEAKIQGVNDVRLPYDEYNAMMAKLEADEDAHPIYSITSNFRPVAIHHKGITYRCATRFDDYADRIMAQLVGARVSRELHGPRAYDLAMSACLVNGWARLDGGWARLNLSEDSRRCVAPDGEHIYSIDQRKSYVNGLGLPAELLSRPFHVPCSFQELFSFAHDGGGARDQLDALLSAPNVEGVLRVDPDSVRFAGAKMTSTLHKIILGMLPADADEVAAKKALGAADPTIILTAFYNVSRERMSPACPRPSRSSMRACGVRAASSFARSRPSSRTTFAP
jgi:hypothetical protein